MLHYADQSILVNIIDSSLVEELHLPTNPCILPLRVTAINNQPIGDGKLYHQTKYLDLQIRLFHHEKATLFIITSPVNPIVLGLPWLQLHESHISWREGDHTHWSCHYQHHCFTHTKPHSCLITSVERTPNSAMLSSYPRTTRCCWTGSARRKLLIFHHIVHGTAPSSYYLMQCHQRAVCTLFHSLRTRPWKNTLRRP